MRRGRRGSGATSPASPASPTPSGRPAGRDLPPLAALLGLAVALRVFLSLVYLPVALNQFDTNPYVWQAAGGLFESVIQAPGYSLFLRVAHVFSDDVAFTVSVQHLLPLVTAALAWHLIFRITGSRWWSLVPAAFVLFEADALLVEHALMSETLFTLLVVAFAWAGLGALGDDRPLAWLVASGILLGAAIWVRYAAVGLVPVLLVWALVVGGASWRGRLAAGAAAAGAITVIVGAHVVLQGAQTGSYGLGETGGWALYSRVAPFADCTRFDPPPGTEGLCQRTPSDDRVNPDTGVALHPDWYGYDPRSPARRTFGGQPGGDAKLRAWAQRAILAQPLDYAAAVAQDVGKFFDPPAWTNDNESLIGPRSVSFRLRAPDAHCADCTAPGLDVEANTLHGLTAPEHGAYYESFEPEVRNGVEFFQDYQRAFRMHPWLFAIAVILALLGLFAATGRWARAQWFLTFSGVALLVFPVATTTYNVRYGMPASVLLVLAATLGAWFMSRAVAPLLTSSGRYGARP